MRPAVLIVDPDEERRRTLSQGLAELGYESVPAAGRDEGLRFARGLEPGVIVAAAELAGFGDATVLDSLAPQSDRTLLLLGEIAGDESELPEEVYLLATAGLSHPELLRRVRLVLVGREVGVDPDLELRSLVGELSLCSLLEVVRALHRSLVSGRIEVADGAVFLTRGEVVAATSGEVTGTKAFLRLCGHHDGPFHVYLGRQEVAEEMRLEVEELLLRAVEESQIELPDLGSRLRLTRRVGPEDSTATDLRVLLRVIERCSTVGEFLDALPASDGRLAQALAVLVKQGEVKLEKPRAAVRVLTDSTADLPADLARAHDIEVVPLSILFGDSAFRDGVELTARDFYHLLASSEEHPETRPPPEAEFYEHFCDLLNRQDVVAVHISSELSETFKNSRQAALRGIRGFDHLPPERHSFALEVVDSRSVSVGVGLLALFAARMAHRGLGVYKIVQHLKVLLPRVHLLFMVDTLDYLVRGGRIGRARALVGKLLGIKPILGMVDGVVGPIDRARGRGAHRRLVKRLAERVDPEQPIIAGVAHAQAPVKADLLRSLIEERFTVREMILSDIGPVVGTHAGPGCVGCVALQPTAEEWPLLEALPAPGH